MAHLTISFEALVYALVFAILVPFTAALFPQVRERYWRYREIRRTGLKAILLRSTPWAQDQLRKLLREAETGNKVLILGRTHLGLLSDNEVTIEDALERGATVQFLLLDLEALRRQEIDLRSLRIPDAEATLSRDLGVAQAKLMSLRGKCRKTTGKVHYSSTVLWFSSKTVS